MRYQGKVVSPGTRVPKGAVIDLVVGMETGLLTLNWVILWGTPMSGPYLNWRAGTFTWVM